ncbi:hypothetical protein FDP41_009679 [Naegleria fowleri]|uniref:Uncharacterized protein n=1 Tax=Naegleria fowleri TaxID=5763 RepID=A0A6A5AV26_NAEFO|nr:uncharacterized protein FDP41_009679 [Naegleria fowleri]KAF0971983.1 hypothetical protein FDP41_009679 [Naegleria fowleri]CAG4711685.1 unnamed protein product [Naegleria fowleri]
MKSHLQRLSRFANSSSSSLARRPLLLFSNDVFHFSSFSATASSSFGRLTLISSSLENRREFHTNPISNSEVKRTEQDLAQILHKHFGEEGSDNDSTVIKVNDISGGCGAMFDILVVSKKFEGVSLVKQHKMVMEVLKRDIQNMHGLTINTKTPAQYSKIVQSRF